MPQTKTGINSKSAGSIQVKKWLWNVLLAGAFAAVLGLVLAVAYALWLTGISNGMVSEADASLSLGQHARESNSSAGDLQKAVDAAVDAAMKRDEALLDKLLLLVGIYSTILSVLALATVVFSRQDAKERLQSVGDLEEELKARFPNISRLENHIQDLLSRLEAKYPEGENFNRPRQNSWKTELKHQDTLIDEMQVLAISVVISEEGNLFKFYLLLSKSYLEQFRTGVRADRDGARAHLTDSDAARAYLYAHRAVECDRDSAEAYRMRGLVSLSRYDAAKPEWRESEEFRDEFRDLLQQAKKDFLQCKLLDPINAGAYYNLALIGLYQGDIDEAIRLSEEVLAKRAQILRGAKEKYFPDIYINLACFLADKAKTLGDTAAKDALYARILTECKGAKAYLSMHVKSSKAMENFTSSLGRELGEKGDFAAVPEGIRDELKKLL